MAAYDDVIKTQLERAAAWYVHEIQTRVAPELLHRSTIDTRAKGVASTLNKLTSRGLTPEQWPTLSDYLGMRLVTRQGVRADDVVAPFRSLPGVVVGPGDVKCKESGEGVLYTATHYALTCTTRPDADPAVPRPTFEVELQVRDLLEDTLATWTHSSHKAGSAGPPLAHPGELKHRHAEDKKWIADQAEEMRTGRIDAAAEERVVKQAVQRLQEHLAAPSAARLHVGDVDSLDKHMRNIAGLRAAQEAHAQDVLTRLIDAHLDNQHVVVCCVTDLELLARFNSDTVVGDFLGTLNKVMRKYPLQDDVSPRVVTAVDRILLISKWQQHASAQETLRLLKAFYNASAGSGWAEGPRVLADHVLKRCRFEEHGGAAAAGPEHPTPPSDQAPAGAHNRSELQPDAALRADEQLKSPNGRYCFYMQADGNAVWKDAEEARWATGTNGKAHGPYRLHMQRDNNLVVYSGDKALWASNTAGRMEHGAASLHLLDTGDLVVRAGNHNLWKKP